MQYWESLLMGWESIGGLENQQLEYNTNYSQTGKVIYVCNSFSILKNTFASYKNQLSGLWIEISINVFHEKILEKFHEQLLILRDTASLPWIQGYFLLKLKIFKSLNKDIFPSRYANTLKF